ncbi:MAG: ribosome-associated translation inhibitor RaiA [Patescibacteria group bacterium]
MQINKIKATNIELTEAIKAYVEEKFLSLAKLTVNYEPAATVDIEVGKESEHHQKGPFFKCEATMQIPGDVIRVDVADEDLYAAIDKAKDLLKDRLAEKKDVMVGRRHESSEESEVTEDTTASI